MEDSFLHRDKLNYTYCLNLKFKGLSVISFDYNLEIAENIEEMESSKNTPELKHEVHDSSTSGLSSTKEKVPIKISFLDRISANLVQQVAISIAVVMVAIFMYDLSSNSSNSGQTQGANTWVWPVIILLSIIFIAVIAFSVYLKRRKKRLKKIKRFKKI